MDPGLTPSAGVIKTLKEEEAALAALASGGAKFIELSVSASDHDMYQRRRPRVGLRVVLHVLPRRGTQPALDLRVETR